MSSELTTLPRAPTDLVHAPKAAASANLDRIDLGLVMFELQARTRQPIHPAQARLCRAALLWSA